MLYHSLLYQMRGLSSIRSTILPDRRHVKQCFHRQAEHLLLEILFRLDSSHHLLHICQSIPLAF